MKVTHYRKIAIPHLEESWENMLPIIESHFIFVASVKILLDHSLYKSTPFLIPLFTSEECAPLWYNTHGSPREINNKEDGETIPWFFFFLFFLPKWKLLFCFVQTLQPKGLDMLYTQDPEMKHLAQCSFLCRSFIYCLRSISDSRTLMYISSQQPSRPIHEEVDVLVLLTVKRVTHNLLRK